MSNENSAPVPSELEPGSESRPVGAIRVGDKTFSSVEDLTEAYRNSEAHRKALESTVGRQGNELGSLRNGSGSNPPPATDEDDIGIPKAVFDSFEADFVADPGKAIKNVVKKTIEVTTEKVTNQLTGQMRRENVVEAFWADYFDKFQTHKEIEAYVRMEGTGMANSGMLKGQTREQQMETVAARINEAGRKAFSGETVRDVPDSRVVSQPGRGSGTSGGGSRGPKTPEKKVTFMDEVRSSVYRKSSGI